VEHVGSFAVEIAARKLPRRRSLTSSSDKNRDGCVEGVILQKGSFVESNTRTATDCNKVAVCCSACIYTTLSLCEKELCWVATLVDR